MRLAAVAFALAFTLPVSPRAVPGEKCVQSVANRTAGPCGRTGVCSIEGGSCLTYSTQFTDLSTCAGFCSDLDSQRRFCSLFSHDNTTNLCTLWLAEPVDYEPRPNSTDIFYAIDKCFTCKSHDCTAPTNANILNNPNFELSKTLIGPWQVQTEGNPQSAYTIVRNPVGHGNAIELVLSIDDDGLPTGTDGLVQGPSLCSKQSYEINVDFKVEQLMPTPPKANTTQNALEVGYIIGDNHNFASFKFDDSKLGKWHTLRSSVGGASAIQTGGLEIALDSQLPIFPVVAGIKMTWKVTLANLRMSRLAVGPLKTKGQSVVANGGFESGKLHPWTINPETLALQGALYPGANPCVLNDPLFQVASPGLPAMKGIATDSKHRFSYCGRAISYYSKAYAYYDYHYTRSGQFFILEQHIPTPTVIDMPYVLTIEYSAGDNALLHEVQYGDVVFGNDRISAGDDEFRYEQYEIYPNPTNITTVFQRIITGTGKPALLNLTFTGFSLVAPLDIVRIDVDNVSIKPLAT